MAADLRREGCNFYYLFFLSIFTVAPEYAPHSGGLTFGEIYFASEIIKSIDTEYID